MFPIFGYPVAWRLSLAGTALLSTLGQVAWSDSNLPEIDAMPGSSKYLRATERQITQAPHGHILTNIGAWSHDGQWIVYDVRSDPSGTLFDGDRIERVHVDSGEVQTLYIAGNGACCGVVTSSPRDDRVLFIHGPDNPTPAWSYAAYHRRGVIVSADRPGKPATIDARDLTAPFTAGALRGGTHVHTFSADGQWIAFTYEDHVLAALGQNGTHDWNLRNVGVSVPNRPVRVPHDHPRNHDGAYFSVLVSRTVNRPEPGSDQICRAYEDAWIGVHGYLKRDGTRQKRAIAFQGDVVTQTGQTISEVYLVDLPDDLTTPGQAPLEGTATTRPAPPRGVVQRRLTHTAKRKYPGLQGPRHWLRSAPDGSWIAFLMKDDAGIVQLWKVSPHGGVPVQITHHEIDIGSAFSWSPNGRWIAHALGQSVCITDADNGTTIRLVGTSPGGAGPRPEACVFAPDGKRIAYVRPVRFQDRSWNQIFVLTLEGIPQ